VRLKNLWSLSLLGCVSVLCVDAMAQDDGHVHSQEPILPVPLDHEVLEEKAALGKKLFHETLLSGDNSLSCASCHDLNHFGGAEDKPFSTGIKGRQGVMNAPTVVNSRFNFAQFWDGRAENLSEQAAGPVSDPDEMGANWDEVLVRLRNQADYAAAFNAIYTDGITQANVTDAIESYEYTLNAVNAPFDQYLRGDENAITDQQKRGYVLFKDYGCVACHQGVNVGGNMFQRIGAFLPYFNETNRPTPEDRGRYNVTKDKRDMHVFKVPSLRMAAHTAPYFHDGSVKTLAEAIDIMARYQLGYTIPKQDNEDIQAFIRSLSGQIPDEVKP